MSALKVPTEKRYRQKKIFYALDWPKRYCNRIDTFIKLNPITSEHFKEKKNSSPTIFEDPIYL